MSPETSDPLDDARLKELVASLLRRIDDLIEQGKAKDGRIDALLAAIKSLTARITERRR